MNGFVRASLLGVLLIAAGAVFAAPSKVDPKDVKTTESGLKYAVLKPGAGTAVKKNHQVKVHYTGWLDNGKQFDSSRDGGEPIEFIVGRGMVIPGWDEGLQGMTVGEQRQLVIPPKLAYGDQAVGGDLIPANSTLTFDVELVEIVGLFEPSEKPSKVGEKDLKTTKSGLKYAVLTEGKGTAAKKDQLVTVHYSGWLTNGTKFDSSVDRGQPFRFPLGAGRVIKGWDEGVEGMKPGEKRQLVIPFQLAYGEQGRPPRIPPSSTLIFDVYLIRAEDLKQ